MMIIDCEHKDAQETGHICIHLLNVTSSKVNYAKWFTGTRHESSLICMQCYRRAQEEAISINDIEMHQICLRCFRDIEEKGFMGNVLGLPEIYERVTSLSFSHQIIPVLDGLTENLLEIQPIDGQRESAWIGLTEKGNVVYVDFSERKTTHIMQLSSSKLDLQQEISLHVATDGQMAAIVNTFGQYGIVINLTTKQITMHLERDDDHIDFSHFPIAFFTMDEKLLLIHGTEWNRLDISDPETGALITARSARQYKEGESRPEHYLDYFHCGLTVSMDQEWIVDNGWVWMPIGIVTSWNLKRWAQESVWESEDGPSMRELCARWYYWGGSLCWLDSRTLAIWGYGNDEAWLIPAARIFDVVSGKELRWFAGPQGDFVFDTYLFSLSEEHGTAVWDIATGERIFWDAHLHPMRYHRGAKQFLSLLPDGAYRISTLSE